MLQKKLSEQEKVSWEKIGEIMQEEMINKKPTLSQKKEQRTRQKNSSLKI